MKILSKAVFLVMFSVLALISCSSGSLTDEQAIQLFRAEAGYPRKGHFSLYAKGYQDPTVRQEVDQLVKAGFLKKKGTAMAVEWYDAGEKGKGLISSLALSPRDVSADASGFELDVVAVRDRRNIDSNTAEIVFELKTRQTPQFNEFQQTAPTIAKVKPQAILFFAPADPSGMAVALARDAVELRKVVFKKWEKGWRVANF